MNRPIVGCLTLLLVVSCGEKPSSNTPPVQSSPPAAKANQAPEITAIASELVEDSTDKLRLSVTASDPDGDTLTYQWQASAGSLTDPKGKSPVWKAPTATGRFPIKLIVSDGKSRVEAIVPVGAHLAQSPANIPLEVTTFQGGEATTSQIDWEGTGLVDEGVSANATNKVPVIRALSARRAADGSYALGVRAEEPDGELMELRWRMPAGKLTESTTSPEAKFDPVEDTGLFVVVAELIDKKGGVTQGVFHFVLDGQDDKVSAAAWSFNNGTGGIPEAVPLLNALPSPAPTPTPSPSPSPKPSGSPSPLSPVFPTPTPSATPSPTPTPTPSPSPSP